jgi:hypothetical protein
MELQGGGIGMELLYAILVVLGVAALAELILWPKVYQRPPWGKRVFEWVLVPLLVLIFVALVAQLGDPSALITALIVVGMLALVFSVP